MDLGAQEPARVRTLLVALTVRFSDATSNAVKQATGLTEVESGALAVLATSLSGAPLQAVADALALTQPGATRLVDRLVKRGLVERRPGPDGRTRSMRLTTTGEDVAQQAAATREDVATRLLQPLGPRDHDRLGALLERLLEPAATSGRDAVRGCRFCVPLACGHYEGRCPVTRGLDARGQ